MALVVKGQTNIISKKDMRKADAERAAKALATKEANAKAAAKPRGK
jgi:hypothetical protein